MDFYDDFCLTGYDTKFNESAYEFSNHIFDFPIFHSTPSVGSRSNPTTRSIDFPSVNRHYGVVTLFDYKLPIIYRLLNDTYYVPYIRFSYVLNIFEHTSYKNSFANIRNIPLIEMTPDERSYYDQLSSLGDYSDWSNYQLLSVSILDGIIAILDLTKDLKSTSDISRKQLTDMFNTIKRKAHDQWLLDEKVVINRIKQNDNKIDSKCISSSINMAKRRSFFEQRLESSIVNDSGGFIQINAFIYPYIKDLSTNRIYINLNDVREHYDLPSLSLITYSTRSSMMYHAYNVIVEQAETNYELNRMNTDLSKFLPINKRVDDENLPFVKLENLIKLFRNKNLNFIQLFETTALDDMKLNYKRTLDREFILKAKRQGGLMNNSIPCLVFLKSGRQCILIPSEKRTKQIMNNDERLYLNIILLYNGLWKNVLTKNKQWYLKQIDDCEKENARIEILFDSDKFIQI